MKKLLLLVSIVAGSALGLNTINGHRGWLVTYSGLCESMGMMSLNANTYFYQGAAYRIYTRTDTAGNTITDTIQGTSMYLGPVASLAFAPWDYLEFSVLGKGTYEQFSPPTSDTIHTPYTSPTEDLYRNIGFSAKGGYPFYFGNFYFAPALEGFAYMDIVNTSNMNFGGHGIMSFGYGIFSLDINGGYTYYSASSNGLIDGTAAIGMELKNYLALSVEGIFSAPQDFSTQSLYVLPGMKLFYRTKSFVIGLNTGFSYGILRSNLEDPWQAVGGITIGYDFITEPGKKTITGIVKDSITGAPLSGATVRLKNNYANETFTDNQGAFILKTPKIDSVTIEHPDYNSKTVGVQKINGEWKIVDESVSQKKDKGEAILKPKKGNELSGTVTDYYTGNPIKALVRFTSYSSDTIIPSTWSDAVSGYFETEVVPGTYRVEVVAPGYKTAFKNILIRANQTTRIDFKLLREKKPIKKPKRLYFPSVYFNRGATIPTYYSYGKLLNVVDILRRNPNVSIEVRGYTDSVGRRDVNYRISIRRAQWVKNYLVSKGIAPSRIRVRGFGENYPRGDNRTIAGRRINRRVEIIAIQ